MPKVYILNKGAHDFSAAKRYGELVYCTTGTLSKYNTSHMVRLLTDAMEGSTKEDFILLTSLTSLCSIACSLFSVKHRCLNLLIYQEDGYVARKIVFE